MMDKTCIFIGLFAVGLIVYQNNQKSSDYKEGGGYENVSNMKHDIFKDMFMQLVPLIVLSQGTLYDKNNVFSTIVGVILLNTLGYVIFYQIIEPHVLNKSRNF